MTYKAAPSTRERPSVELKTNNGHDSFLLHEPELFDTIRGFVNAAARRRGIAEPEGWLP